jgi:hypothetical protein
VFGHNVNGDVAGLQAIIGLAPRNILNCANAGVAAVHIRYRSAPSLYLLLVCANANPSVSSLFLPLWGISSPQNPGLDRQDTRFRTTPLPIYSLSSATGIHSSLDLSMILIRPGRRYRCRGAQVRKAFFLDLASSGTD